ncbi:MAG: hypothetical protein KTR32_24465 [Granulosicoccus sp.]|nr:hypothetical protein [Granulosicoccus sp.]
MAVQTKGKTGVTDSTVAQYVNDQTAPNQRVIKTLRTQLNKIRQQLPLCGDVQESLKWGELSFATEAPKTGTPIRLSYPVDEPGVCTLSVHCQTTLIAEFREMYPELRFDRNRSLLVDHKSLASPPVLHFLEEAMTYHLRKRNKG